MNKYFVYNIIIIDQNPTKLNSLWFSFTANQAADSDVVCSRRWCHLDFSVSETIIIRIWTDFSRSRWMLLKYLSHWKKTFFYYHKIQDTVLIKRLRNDELLSWTWSWISRVQNHASLFVFDGTRYSSDCQNWPTKPFFRANGCWDKLKSPWPLTFHEKRISSIWIVRKAVYSRKSSYYLLRRSFSVVQSFDKFLIHWKAVNNLIEIGNAKHSFPSLDDMFHRCEWIRSHFC